MQIPFEIDGYWWLPDNPDKRIAGVLYYTIKEELSLKLLDDFRSITDCFTALVNGRLHPPPIIHGMDADANLLTLLVSSHGERRWNLSSSFPIVHYNIQYCLKGILLDSAEDKIFVRTEIGLSQLSSWMKKYPIHNSTPTNSENGVQHFALKYAINAEYELISIGDGFSLSLEPKVKFSSLQQEVIILQQGHIVAISRPTAFSLTTLLTKCYRFKSFLTMATLQPAYFISLKLYCNEHLPKSIGDTPHSLPIEVFLHQPDIQDTTHPTQANRYLFSYPDIQQILPEILLKWFSFDHLMMPIIHHLMESIREKRRFRSTDFLIIVQALEGYHHRFFDRKPEKKKNLEYRLKNLKNFFESEVISVREIDITVTIASRHYYSHFYAKDANQSIAEGEDLYHLTTKLQRLLICCFLHELGINNTTIQNILQKHIDYVG